MGHCTLGGHIPSLRGGRAQPCPAAILWGCWQRPCSAGRPGAAGRKLADWAGGGDRAASSGVQKIAACAGASPGPLPQPHATPAMA